MELKELLEVVGNGKTEVREDSRKVGQGDVFVAISGSKSDGASFAEDAVKNGARYIVCARHTQGGIAETVPGTEIIAVADPREALTELAQARYGTKNLPMKFIGITGTNGKTTCAWLLDHFLTAMGRKTGLLGTIAYRWPGYSEAASLTTPGPLELNEILAKMRDAGTDTVIMEVSSHALAQKRVDGIDFSGAIFTNLTQDHLDFHREMESYFRAKARLFLALPLQDKAMAMNCDDRYGRRLLELSRDALSYGLHQSLPGRRHLLGTVEELSLNGMTINMQLDGNKWQLKTPLIGEFNALNLLAVSALILQMGMEPETLKALETFKGVPGRLERVENPQGLHIFVDYAHTPDALSNALRALRGAGFKRIITIFGCGGNRDRDKRPLMGKAVADNADVAILTSDNPRHEAPEAIMRDVKPGLAKSRHALFEVDRKAATARGLQLLGPEDALLIAGKGHENYQIIGDERRHYSDQEVVRELLNCA